MSATKQRLVQPSGSVNRVPTVNIRHPHYPSHNTIVRLPALDDGETIDYDVALIICGIIADNSWASGWFARAQDGSDLCQPGTPLDTRSDFYYFVNDRSYKYPVYATWDHWRLPRAESDLPSAFSALLIDPPPSSLLNGGYMEDLKSRDQSCRVSGIIDCCEQAHLVPAGEGEWWDANMGESSDLPIQSAYNGMLLRADLHRSFDSGTWIPFARSDGLLVLYVVRTTAVSNQFATLWHNREMQQLAGIDRRCLFARVAWAVLSLHYKFLSTRRLAHENLLVRLNDGKIHEMTPESFKHFSRSRSRIPSPTKRPRLRISDEDGGIGIEAEWACDNDTLYEHARNHQPSADLYSAPFERGRKRFRTPDETPVVAKCESAKDNNNEETSSVRGKLHSPQRPGRTLTMLIS